jgi:hypothetical protein
MSKQPHLRKAAAAGLAGLFITAVYEAAKQIVLAKISLVQIRV